MAINDNADMSGRCELCGEPLPRGEQMFRYHGLSGPCPKPPLPKAKTEVMVEYIHRDQDGQFWVDIDVNRSPYLKLGPFDTGADRERAKADLLDMMRSLGAKDVPGAMQ